MKQKRMAELILMVLAVLMACSNGKSGNGDIGLDCSVSNSFVSQSTVRPQNMTEPSGIVYHAARNTIFVVGDEGDIAEVNIQGITLQSRRIDNLDLEGVTVDPGSGLLYIIVEASSLIHEIDPANLQITRSFNLDWELNGRAVLPRQNEAIESISFVTDSTHEQGGTFYLVNRSKQIDSDARPSALFQFQLPLRDLDSPSSGTLLASWPLEISSISGLYFDTANKLLLAVSDDRDAVFKLSLNGVVHGCFQIPGTQQEGITLTPTGVTYIADDREGVVYIFDD